MMREITKERNTNETKIKMTLRLDGEGVLKGTTGIGFFDHMLHLMIKHGKMDCTLVCEGDLWIDGHHLIEDLGIVLGECLSESLGNKRGIARYGMFICPMDETLTTVNIDLSGRGYLVYHCGLNREKIGDFETELLQEFLYAFAINAKMNLHVNVHYGTNDHHKVESIFKALGRSIKEAVHIEGDDIPSTKGVLA